MRLRQIEVFFHVYREGSISAAARALYVSQPSVSKVLRHAEDQLGFALFDRRQGRLYPTKAADELFAEVEDIYDRIGALNRTAINIRNRRGGHIRLGVVPSFGFAVAPKFIAAMHEVNPDLSFDLTTLHTDDIEPGLIERRYDLCIGFEDGFDDRIAMETINGVELVLLARPGQIESSDGKVAIEALAGRKFVGLRDSGPVGKLIGDTLAENGIEPEEVVTAQTHYIAAELVQYGVGMAIVDAFTAQRFSSRGLAGHPLKEPLALPFGAMFLAENGQPDLIGQCVDTLRELFG